MSGRLSIRGRIILGLGGLCLCGAGLAVDVDVVVVVVVAASGRPLSPCVSPLATGEDACGESERDSLRLKHMEEEFSSLDEESWKEQSSSERGRGGGEGHASGGGSSSESSSPFPKSYGEQNKQARSYTENHTSRFVVTET